VPDIIAAKILLADPPGPPSVIVDFLRAARLLAASAAIRLGQRFGFEPATMLDLRDQLGGGDLGATLRREVVTRRSKPASSSGSCGAISTSGAYLRRPMPAPSTCEESFGRGRASVRGRRMAAT
jgi:hypothetical protein